MKTAIILHGMPSKEKYFDASRPSQSNSHWLPWIQQELLIVDILAQTPEMPEPYEPDYEKWRSVFEQFTINEETILIGHSCGAGFLVRWLSENKIQVGRVALVAPWLNPDHEYKTQMFDFKIDPSLTERTDGVTIFISSDDSKPVLDSVDKIKSVIQGIVIKEYTDRGHFTFGTMKTDAFPELRDVLINK